MTGVWSARHPLCNVWQLFHAFLEVCQSREGSWDFGLVCNQCIEEDSDGKVSVGHLGGCGNGGGGGGGGGGIQVIFESSCKSSGYLILICITVIIRPRMCGSAYLAGFYLESPPIPSTNSVASVDNTTFPSVTLPLPPPPSPRWISHILSDYPAFLCTILSCLLFQFHQSAW